ncbi:hypothetical protein [Rhizobium sp. BG4]|uniref:hypothetical protein n=1 Tax=unclassified Rhizobium TaxID=2613769 RepID=UPI000DD891AD|nr:hypothetical protein [Rhizobium sp. BG4]QRM44544.1 hypothetical protein F2982_14480 [Rhizobium sp. BG4]
MLSALSIVSLDQGKLYGDRIPVDDLPVLPAPPRLSLLRRLAFRLHLRKRKDPAEAGSGALPAAGIVTG